MSRILIACLLASGLSNNVESFAANLARGKTLYLTTPNRFAIPFNCADAGCHTADPAANVKLNGKGSSTAAITTAINSGVPTMAIYGPVGGAGNLTVTDITDIAAYISNPNAAVLVVTTTTLTFPPVALNAPAPTQNITVTNDGSANLNVTSAATSGANAGDFTATHNCTNIASAATCTMVVTMLTTTGGAKTATLTIASNGGANKLVTLSGTVSGLPSASLNAPGGGLIFPDTTIGSTSVASNMPVVTLTNGGSAPLNISALTASTGFNLNLTPASACKVGTPVAAGQSCTLSVRFAPGTAALITGSLTIAHNAASSPSTIALSGTGLASTTAAAALDKSALSFGDHIVGTASLTQTVILTSSGASPLTITNIQSSSTEFIRTGTCAAGQLPVASTCTIIVGFNPASIGSKNATITITDDAGNVPGSTQTIDLSGIGVAAAALLPTPALSATALTFTIQSLNTASAAQTVTIKNESNSDPLNIAIAKTGANAGEYLIDGSVSGSCLSMTPVPPLASCTLTVTFTPTATGSRAATIEVTTNGTGSPHAVTLTGTGTGSATGIPPGEATTGVATNAGGGGCAMQSDGKPDLLLLALFLLGAFGTSMRRRQTSINLNARREHKSAAQNLVDRT